MQWVLEGLEVQELSTSNSIYWEDKHFHFSYVPLVQTLKAKNESLLLLIQMMCC